MHCVRVFWFAAALMLTSTGALANERGSVIRAGDLYTEPFVDAAKVGTLAPNQPVTILARKGGWLSVETGGKRGWVRMLIVRLDAAAPRVAIAYAPGVHRAIAIAGQPIADGAELRPTRPLVLEIAGVGRVTITPVAATDLAEDQNDLDARRQELAAALGAMGAADVEAAREALAARRDLETQRAAIAQRLAALAPDGLGVLEQRLEAAEREIEAGGDGPETLPPRDDLAAGVKRLDRDYREAVAAATAAERTAAQQAQVVTRLRTTMDALAARCATLDAELIQADEAGGRLQALEALSADATAAANSAVREAAAFAETAPTDEAWAAMQTTLQRHEQALARPAAEIAEVTQAIARIEGDLDRGGDSDIAQRIDELSGALDGVRAKAGRFKQEVDALTLLSRLIEEAEAASQDRFLAPVLARIEPYLRCVLPEARLHLSRELTPSGLARGAGLETAAALSGGTQEQLAVLTRLGFGRLLADRGQPTPVILDDALVYSDDTRIERLFEVLRAASQHHQVIVLTCRSRLFAALGGTPLQITPWKVDA
mgnify:CR=1 FL=1